MFVHCGDSAGPEVYGFQVTVMLSQHAAQQDKGLSLMWRSSWERAQPKKKLVKSKAGFQYKWNKSRLPTFISFVIFSPFLRSWVRLGPHVSVRIRPCEYQPNTEPRPTQVLKLSTECVWRSWLVTMVTARLLRTQVFRAPSCKAITLCRLQYVRHIWLSRVSRCAWCVQALSHKSQITRNEKRIWVLHIGRRWPNPIRTKTYFKRTCSISGRLTSL